MSASRFSIADIDSMSIDLNNGVGAVAIGLKWSCSPSHVCAMCRGEKGPRRVSRPMKGTRSQAKINRAKILALSAKGLRDSEIGEKLNLSTSYTSSLRRGLPKKKKAKTGDGWHGYKEENWSHDLSKKWAAMWYDLNKNGVKAC